MNQTDYFTEKIATLPEELQDAIRMSDYENVLKNTQREYKLHIDQAQTLETLALQLIFGDIDAPTFVNHMFNEAHVSSAVAGDILLKIDTLILRKIRTYLEDIAETRKKEEMLQKALMSEKEEEEENISDAYATYYAELAHIKQEAEKELIQQGIKPDGSNITDDMLAGAMGISVEDLHRKTEIGGIAEANTIQPNSYINTPVEIQTEKQELLSELESPQKSFATPLFTPVTQLKKVQMPFIATTAVKKEEVFTLPDHQLENVSLEKPYVEEATVPSPVIEKQTPTIKIPTKIVLANDPYKEPIE